MEGRIVTNFRLRVTKYSINLIMLHYAFHVQGIMFKAGAKKSAWKRLKGFPIRLQDGNWDYCSLDYRHTRYGEVFSQHLFLKTTLMTFIGVQQNN